MQRTDMKHCSDTGPVTSRPCQLLSVFLIAISVASILPLLYLCRYDFPNLLDDWGNSHWTSLLDYQQRLYNTWSGRYFGNLMGALDPAHWHSIICFRMVVCAIMLAFISTYCLLIKSGLRTYTHMPALCCWSLALFATTILLNNLPSLAEGFYWFSSETTYILPLIGLLLLLLMLMRAAPAYSWSLGRVIAAVLLIICTIGGNETLILPCFIATIGEWAASRRNAHGSQTRIYKSLIAVCLICAAAAVLAPGNFKRLSHSERSIFAGAVKWVYYSQQAFVQWLSDPYLLMFSSVTVWMLYKHSSFRPKMNLLQAFALPLALTLLLHLPTYFILGAAPLRITNIAYLFFLLGWIAFLVHCAAYTRELKTSGLLGKQKIIKHATIIFFGFLFLNVANPRLPLKANVFVAYKSLAQKVPQSYQQEAERRFSRDTSNRKGFVSTLQPVFQRDNLLYLSDSVALLLKKP